MTCDESVPVRAQLGRKSVWNSKEKKRGERTTADICYHTHTHTYLSRARTDATLVAHLLATDSYNRSFICTLGKVSSCMGMHYRKYWIHLVTHYLRMSRSILSLWGGRCVQACRHEDEQTCSGPVCETVSLIDSYCNGNGWSSLWVALAVAESAGAPLPPGWAVDFSRSMEEWVCEDTRHPCLNQQLRWRRKRRQGTRN